MSNLIKALTLLGFTDEQVKALEKDDADISAISGS